MKKAFVCTIEDYDKLLYNVSNGNIGIANNNLEWFYTVSVNYCEDATEENVTTLLKKEFNMNIEDIIVDVHNEKVAIIFA